MSDPLAAPEKLGPPVSVTFLGTCSGGGPIPSRNCSSLAVNLDGPLWLFDCAEGTQLQLMKSKLKISKIVRILITHMHADHSMGIVPLLGTLLTGVMNTPETVAAMAALGKQRKAKIHIYGPPGLRLLIRQTLLITNLTLSAPYAVHELVPNPACLPTYSGGREPVVPVLLDGGSCGCAVVEAGKGFGVEGLGIFEAVGMDLMADEDGCWRDILGRCEGAGISDTNGWKVDAGPIEHRVPSMGYVLTESNPSGTFTSEEIDRVIGILAKHRIALARLDPPIRHPNQVLGILSKTGRAYVLPDGTILQPPGPPTQHRRKLVILGDCSGVSNTAFRTLASDPSLLVHECTNASIPPALDWGKKKWEESYHAGHEEWEGKAKAKEVEAVRIKALGRGHSTPEVAGTFARGIRARRLALNHFSAKYPASSHASDEPFPSFLSSSTETGAMPDRFEIHRRIVLASIAQQTASSWVGDDTSLNLPAMSRDFMEYDVLAHELTAMESSIVAQRVAETDLALKAFTVGGASAVLTALESSAPKRPTPASASGEPTHPRQKPRPNAKSPKPCAFFGRGVCRDGDACRFAHITG